MTEEMKSHPSDDGLIGLTFEQAAIHAAGHGLTVRMTYFDGRACIVSRDFNQNRINVAVIDGIIAETLGRG